MAGHSHWANIAHKKGLIDSQARQALEQARQGDHRRRQSRRRRSGRQNLRSATRSSTPKRATCPRTTIDRAIKKGTGELEGVNYEEILYEGYGPGGVAVLCDILTDNRNRTAREVRKIFEMAGGKLGATGCVAWMFDRKGLLVIPADQTDEESLMELALEAGADDVQHVGDNFRNHLRARTSSAAVCDAIDKAGLKPESQRDHAHPQGHRRSRRRHRPQRAQADGALDDHDDVQKVAAEFQHPRRSDGGDRGGVSRLRRSFNGRRCQHRSPSIRPHFPSAAAGRGEFESFVNYLDIQPASSRE